MMVHAHQLGTGKAEEGRPPVQGQPELLETLSQKGNSFQKSLELGSLEGKALPLNTGTHPACPRVDGILDPGPKGQQTTRQGCPVSMDVPKD